MSLVPCHECGHSLADSAPACTNCGALRTGELEVRRVKRHQGSAVPLAVWIDSEHVGILYSGESLKKALAPGVHRIDCKFQQPLAKQGGEDFTVPIGKKLVVVVTTSRLTGKPEFTAEIQ